jgi:hypothetical protein
VRCRRRERLYARFVSIRIMRHQSKQVFIVRVTTAGYGSREHKHIHAVCTIPCVTCSNIFYRRAYIVRGLCARHTHLHGGWPACQCFVHTHSVGALSLTRSNDARLSTLVCPIHHKGLCVVISIICGFIYARADSMRRLTRWFWSNRPCVRRAHKAESSEFVGWCVFANLCAAPQTQY